MIFLMDPEFWARLLGIVIIDLTLAGDNALVIALAVRTLPPRQQLWGRVCGRGGCGGAPSGLHRRRDAAPRDPDAPARRRAAAPLDRVQARPQGDRDREARPSGRLALGGDLDHRPG